jgi:hypothetical protein
MRAGKPCQVGFFVPLFFCRQPFITFHSCFTEDEEENDMNDDEDEITGDEEGEQQEQRGKRKVPDQDDEDVEEMDVAEYSAPALNERKEQPNAPPFVETQDETLPHPVVAAAPALANSSLVFSTQFAAQKNSPFEWETFSVVEETPADHYFASKYPSPNVDRDFLHKVQKEYKIFEALPKDILVRGFEDRTDLLRAIIIGPAGTP